MLGGKPRVGSTVQRFTRVFWFMIGVSGSEGSEGSAARGAGSEDSTSTITLVAVLVPVLTLLIGIPLAVVFMRRARQNDAAQGRTHQNNHQPMMNIDVSTTHAGASSLQDTAMC